MHIMIVFVIIAFWMIHSSHQKQYALNAIKPIWVSVTHREKMTPEQTIKKLSPSISPLTAIQNEKINVVQTKHSMHRLEQKFMHGRELSALVQSLYNQIHQHYQVPEQAVFMQASGVTQVSFLLMQDGTTTALNVTKASKFPMLDLAALQAVSNASPFHLNKYALLKPQTFIISIDFKPTASDENSNEEE